MGEIYPKDSPPWKSAQHWVFIGKRGHLGAVQSRVRQSLMHDSRSWSRFRGHATACRVAPKHGSCTGSMGRVLTSGFLFFALKINRLGFKGLNFF